VAVRGRSRLWPTPTVGHAERGNHDEPVENYLQRVQDYKDGKTKGKPGASLGVAVRMWPTPTTHDTSNNGGPSQYRRNSLPLNAAAGGALNPTWVEWLMG
jgi:hypothetical protein